MGADGGSVGTIQPRAQGAAGSLAGLGGLLVAFGGLLVVLAILAATSGLDDRAWVVGLGSGLGLVVLLARAMRSQGRPGLGPADRVTLVRAVLTCAVAALAVQSYDSHPAPASLVLLSIAAMALDGVDGRIARRTGTASTFGARFDYEVDAFLILVLSAYVATEWGWWVLSLGLARYVFVAAGRAVPWLRAAPPPRPWAKVVAVLVGAVLIVAAAGVLPDALTLLLLLVAVMLLAESFARSVSDLSRLAGGRAIPRGVVTGTLAVLLVWAVLVVPHTLTDVTPGALLRIPVEGLLFLALVLVVPRRVAVTLGVLAGLALAGLVLLRLLDLGFRQAYDAPFHPVYDVAYAGAAVDLLESAFGRAGALMVLVALAVLVAAVLTLLPWAAVRVTGLVAGHRDVSVRLLAGMTAVATVAVLFGARPSPVGSVVTTSSSSFVASRATQIRDDLRDRSAFDRSLDQIDPIREIPEDELLTGLRGKDVLLVFVESYGRRALDLPPVLTTLRSGQSRLEAAGFTARSGWLTSPTFGGLSWLAHASVQSGLWVDNQRRFDRLTTTDRDTLTSAFGSAGWRTVAVAPAVENDWPEATSFYRYDQVYDARNLGYAGPRFGWATMPDQFALAAFERAELATADRSPVMADITLVSSHWPWSPLPRLVGWDALVDGSVFTSMSSDSKSAGSMPADSTSTGTPSAGTTPADTTPAGTPSAGTPSTGTTPASPMSAGSAFVGSALGDAGVMTAAYGRAISYSLDAVTSFVEQHPDPDLVLVVLGDHQPASLVSGQGASRNVPVSIVAADPEITDRAVAWGWQPGLRPDADAPVWPMDEFRDRFLTTYSP